MRGTDAELLHAKQQRGPAHAEQSSSTVRAAPDFPNRVLERGDDFPPFRVFQSPSQTPISTFTRRPRIGAKVRRDIIK
jgi:hypothetical protein